MLAMLACVSLARARPLVRNVKTDDEFRKLLKHHAEVLIPRAHAPHSLDSPPAYARVLILCMQIGVLLFANA